MDLMEVLRYLQTGVDPAALGVARYLYGLVMLIDTFEERGLGNAESRYGTNKTCNFPLFDNMPLLPLPHLYLMFLFMIICIFFVMIGFLFRISITCFAVMYWYLFFLNKTVWNNHSYLYGLLSIIFTLSSASNYWSVDGAIWPSMRNKKVPRWNYMLIKLQLFILYFYAGIKKLDSDWMSGYSMRGLGRNWLFDPFRMFMSNEMVDFVMVHLSGFFLDLTLGFQLIFDKTRFIGYFFAYSFHGMNAIIFNIGMFSYMCMALLPIFSGHDWPKKVIRKLPNFMQPCLPLSEEAQENDSCAIVEGEKKNEPWMPSFKSFLVFGIAALYVLVQLTLPFSHSITKGYNSWTNGLYGYSWDMMVHSWNTKLITVKVVDKATGNQTDIEAYTSSRSRIYTHPDMLKQYAKCLAESMKKSEKHNMTEPQVFVDVWCSLNGRYQQRMINPSIDLVTAKWSPFEDTSWWMPLLSELTPWRKKMKELKIDMRSDKNVHEVIFIADFPGFHLKSRTPPSLNVNVTVLAGKINVEVENLNRTLEVNETLTVPSNSSHKIHTVSETPSCYMLVTHNIANQKEPMQTINDDKEEREKVAKMSYFQTFLQFLAMKQHLYLGGIEEIVMAIFELGDYHGRDHHKKMDFEKIVKNHEDKKKLFKREFEFFSNEKSKFNVDKEDFIKEREVFNLKKANSHNHGSH